MYTRRWFTVTKEISSHQITSADLGKLSSGDLAYFFDDETNYAVSKHDRRVFLKAFVNGKVVATSETFTLAGTGSQSDDDPVWQQIDPEAFATDNGGVEVRMKVAAVNFDTGSWVCELVEAFANRPTRIFSQSTSVNEKLVSVNFGKLPVSGWYTMQIFKKNRFGLKSRAFKTLPVFISNLNILVDEDILSIGMIPASDEDAQFVLPFAVASGNHAWTKALLTAYRDLPIGEEALGPAITGNDIDALNLLSARSLVLTDDSVMIKTLTDPVVTPATLRQVVKNVDIPATVVTKAVISAIERSNFFAAKIMMKSPKFDIDSQNGSFLISAVEMNSETGVSMLLEAGANVHISNDQSFKQSIISSEPKSTAFVDLLLAKSLGPLLENCDDVLLAGIHAKRFDLIKRMMKPMSEMLKHQPLGALINLIESGNVDGVKFLIETFPSVLQNDIYGNALYTAIKKMKEVANDDIVEEKSKYSTVLEVLIHSGATMHSSDSRDILFHVIHLKNEDLRRDILSRYQFSQVDFDSAMMVVITSDSVGTVSQLFNVMEMNDMMKYLKRSFVRGSLDSAKFFFAHTAEDENLYQELPNLMYYANVWGRKNAYVKQQLIQMLSNISPAIARYTRDYNSYKAIFHEPQIPTVAKVEPRLNDMVDEKLVSELIDADDMGEELSNADTAVTEISEDGENSDEPLSEEQLSAEITDEDVVEAVPVDTPRKSWLSATGSLAGRVVNLPYRVAKYATGYGSSPKKQFADDAFQVPARFAADPYGDENI